MHPTHAVSGAVCIAAACKAEGTVARDICTVEDHLAIEDIIIEHPAGSIPIQLEVSEYGKDFKVIRACTIRTVRKLMDGYVYY